MAATSEYPVKGDPLVRGDPWAIPVQIVTEEDTSTWTWRAQLRSTPDSSTSIAFTVDPDPEVEGRFYLRLTSAQSAQVGDGWGFDLEQLTPRVRTWWICPAVHVEKDYSRDA